MNYISKNTEYKEKLLNRFVKYVKTWSESNSELADQGIFPSTEQQKDFARQLCEEMKTLGLQEVQISHDFYVYGYLPGNTEKPAEPVMLMAHLDTVDEVTGKNVNPVVTKIVKTVETESGVQQIEDTIIKSDGTTLLGADDKAGITAIMTAVEYLINHPEIKHCPVEVMFSPDEETGHGMDKVPLNLLKSKAAYTVDGGDEGEMETECFNAWAANITFNGKACHTGDAKAGKMVNANVMAANFIQNLPRHKAPETTENHEGFIAVMSVEGSIEVATVSLLLRAFTTEEIEEEKNIVQKLAEATVASLGGSADLGFKQQYLNMKEKLDQNPKVTERLAKAFTDAGVKINQKPIRGGTDGSRLTEMGIPTPNIFTGAHEFHSRNEWLSLNQNAKAADVLLNLLTQF